MSVFCTCVGLAAFFCATILPGHGLASTERGYEYLLNAGNSWPISSQLMTSSSNARCGAAPPNDFEARAGDARFHGRLGCGGWMPGSNASEEYWQVDLVDARTIAGVTIDGFRHRFTGQLHYMVATTIELSNDGRHFASPRVSLRAQNSTEADQHVEYALHPPTSARYVRLTKFVNDDAGNLGMRVLLVVRPTPDAVQGVCNLSLGLSSPLAIPDSAFTSTHFQPGPGGSMRAYDARLNTDHSAWCFVSLPDTFLQVDLGEEHLLSAILAAGFRAGDTFRSFNQFSVYLDGSPVTQILHPAEREVFTGPQNDSSPLIQTLHRPMRARRVQLRNFGGDGVEVNCLRLELYGCPAVDLRATTQHTPSSAAPGGGAFDGSSLSTETKIGITIGAICTVVIFGTLAVLYLRFRKERHLHGYMVESTTTTRWTESELSVSEETSPMVSDRCADAL